MSADHYDDDGSDVHREVERKARKNHICGACDGTIKAGTKYVSIAWLCDGHWSDLKRCRRCTLIVEHLAEKLEGKGWPGPHSALDCGHDYFDMFEEHPPPEIAALAFCGPEGT